MKWLVTKKEEEVKRYSANYGKVNKFMENQ